MLRERRPSSCGFALVLALCALAPACGGEEGAGEAGGAAPPPKRVTVARVERREVPIVLEWTATLDGYVRADVRPQVEGYVVARLYDEGTRVDEGDPLFQIDDRTYRQALDRAQAALAEAQAEALRARADYDRVAPLADTGAVSRQEVTNAFAGREAGTASVAAARAAVRDARLSLEWTTVRSPVAGVAGLRQVEIGDRVQPTDVLTQVATLDPMRASFSITEEQYLGASELLRSLALPAGTGDAGRANASAAPDPPSGGPPVDAPAAPAGGATLTRGALELVLADGSVYPHAGRLEAVGLGVDPGTGTLPLQALFPNPDLLLRPGQFARIRLRPDEGTDALVFPTKAITELQGLHQVAVADPARGTVELRTIELGARVGELAVVREGLREGELVVVEGVQGLADGARVDPVLASRDESAPEENGGAPEQENGGAPEQENGGAPEQENGGAPEPSEER